MFAGIGIWVLILLDVAFGLPFSMPATWYNHRALWIALAGGLFAVGWALQRTRASEAAVWKPAIAGRRFRRLVLYSRPECHLCDDAKAVLAKYLDYLPEIEEVEIDADPQLQARYGECIPVIEFDGREYFRGRVDEILLRRLIEGTSPAAEGAGDSTN